MKTPFKTKLTTEELNEVVGGSCYELADDCKFFHALNGSLKCWSADSINWDGKNGKAFKSIEAEWAKFGIDLIYFGDPTAKDSKILYHRIMGNSFLPITQEQARQHAMEVAGHYMTYEQWHH